MGIWVIYCHTLKGTERRYVGQTKQSMMKRWAGHVAHAFERPTASVNPFANAIKIHGRDAWEHEELEFCLNQWDADKAEARWIEKFKTLDPQHGFNFQSGGTRSLRLRK